MTEPIQVNQPAIILQFVFMEHCIPRFIKLLFRVRSLHTLHKHILKCL
uniref:Uncharacterized protein n=1 Tax=Arundo donax TaxID=35708 RepID=A0A0A9EI77_ARUDO